MSVMRIRSVRNFVKELNEWKGLKPIDRLICNAGIYQPSRRRFAETGRSSADFRSRPTECQ